MWDGGGLFVGEAGGSTAVHAHYAAQVTVAPSPGLRLRSDDDGPWERYGAAYVPARSPHALDVGGVSAWAVIFVGPETARGRALAARFGEAGIREVTTDGLAEPVAAVFAAWDAGSLGQVEAAAHAVVDVLASGSGPLGPPDDRVADALTAIDARLDDPPSLGELARSVGLSPSRLRHLLVGETGAGFRAHVRWRRLMRAWEIVRAGASLTEAAHAAGFSDSAHLSRTVRRTFGLTPSDVARAIQRR